jgi:hypothetical protein
MIPTSTLAKRLPGWGMTVLKAVGRSFWAWYRGLSMVPMFLVTCALGTAAIVGLGYLPLSSPQLSELRRLAEGLLVITLLLVLIVGMFRGGRSR